MSDSSHTNGIFISFEGGEGSGKTTQINHLADTLRDKGYDVIITREPGGTPEGEKIRNLFVQRDGGNWTPVAECLLLFAARNVHIESLIKPALAAGKIVITDRFTDSTRAYQGYGRGIDLNTIESLKQASIGNLEPDLTLILDIEPETGIIRSEVRLAGETSQNKKTEDRFERLDLTFHKKLRDGYLDIAHKNPERCTVLNADTDIDTLSVQILQTVENFISKKSNAG